MDLRKLLLKDLSARLPYGVKCEIDDIDEPLELESIKFKGGTISYLAMEFMKDT